MKHRFSEDLDFFSPDYDPGVADKVMRYIKAKTGYYSQDDFARMDRVILKEMIGYREANI